MSTPTRTPRKAGAPRRDRQNQGVIVAPEKVDDPKAERVLWDLASQIEGLGGRKSVDGDWLKNPLKWPEGFVIEISKWRTTAPIRWKVYEKSKRTHGKGIEFWLNDEKVIDAENNITASMVDHGGLGGLTDDDHTQYARTDGSRAITGLQTFNAGIATDTIAEKTAAAGVTIDGVLLKDGGATLTENLTISALKTIDGRDVSVDGIKLDTIETGATADQTAAEILAALVTVDGAGSLLDADFLDGLSSLAFLKADGTVVSTGTQVFNEDIKLKPTKRIYFDDTTLTSFIAEASDDVVRISTASTAVADFDSTGLQLQQNLKFLSGTSFSLTLDHAISANRTVTYPDATGTLPLLSLAQTFTAKQDIIPASGTALQVGTTNTSGDMVFGELTGATGYNAFGLQGSLTFGTGAVAQANFYSSTADAILYINNRLNSNISLRIDNVDAFIVKGTNKDTQASANFGVGDYPSGAVSMTISKGAPIFEIRETGALADERNWWFEALSGQLKLRVANDLRTVTSDVMLIDRTTTTVDSIQLITGAVAKAIMDSNGLSASAGFRLRNSGATNYHTLTQAGSTASRTITLPDEAMTLAGRDVANTFSAVQTFNENITMAALKTVDGRDISVDGVIIDDAARKSVANTFTANQTISKVDPQLIIVNTDTGGDSWQLEVGSNADTPAGAFKINETGVADRLVIDALALGARATSVGWIFGDAAGTPAAELHIKAESPAIRFDTTLATDDYEIEGGSSLIFRNITDSRTDIKIGDTGILTLGDVGGEDELTITPGTGATVSNDINAAGGFRNHCNFLQINVAANQSVVILYRDTANNFWGYPMVRSGSITGIAVGVTSTADARTAGTLTVEAYVYSMTLGGLAVATGLQAILDVTNTKFKATTQAKDVDTFSAGQAILCYITTSADWAPTTADIYVTIEYEA